MESGYNQEQYEGEGIPEKNWNIIDATTYPAVCHCAGSKEKQWRKNTRLMHTSMTIVVMSETSFFFVSFRYWKLISAKLKSYSYSSREKIILVSS